jgi:hypothetical protein
MAKFKPAKGKRKSAAVPQGAVPCIILIVGALIVVGLILFLVIKTA